jgi:hypothetical protein
MPTIYDVGHMYRECQKLRGELQGLLGNNDPTVVQIRNDLETINDMIVPAAGKTYYRPGDRQFDMFYAKLLNYHDYGGKFLSRLVQQAKEARRNRSSAPSSPPPVTSRPASPSAPAPAPTPAAPQARQRVDYLHVLDFGTGQPLATFRKLVRDRGGKTYDVALFCRKSYEAAGQYADRIDGLDLRQWSMLAQTAAQLQRIAAEAQRSNIDPYYDGVRLQA